MAKLSGAQVSRAIKKELAENFPSTKFSVRYSSASMTDSVDISWDFGPTEKEVERFVKKYQYGYFNSMEDIYEYEGTKVVDAEGNIEDLGGVKFVFTHRSYKTPAERASKNWHEEFYKTETSFQFLVAKALAESNGQVWEGQYTKVFANSTSRDHEAVHEAYRFLAGQSFKGDVNEFTGLRKLGAWEPNVPEVTYNVNDHRFEWNGEKILYPNFEEQFIIVYDGDKVSMPVRLINEIKSGVARAKNTIAQKAEDAKREETHNRNIAQLKIIINSPRISDNIKQLAQAAIYEMDYLEVKKDIETLKFKRFGMTSPVFINVEWPSLNKNTNLLQYKEEYERDKAEGKDILHRTKIEQVLFFDNINYILLSNCLMCNLPDVWANIGGNSADPADMQAELGYNAEQMAVLDKKDPWQLTPAEEQAWKKLNYVHGTLIYNEDTKESFVADTQGYTYARYCGFPSTDEAVHKALLFIDITKVKSETSAAKPRVLPAEFENMTPAQFFAAIDLSKLDDPTAKTIQEFTESEEFKSATHSDAFLSGLNLLAESIYQKFPEALGVKPFVDEDEIAREAKKKDKSDKMTVVLAIDQKISDLEARHELVTEMKAEAKGKKAKAELQDRIDLIEEMLESAKIEKENAMKEAAGDPNFAKGGSITDKNWIIIDGNKEAEYSKDFNFFHENQIGVAKSGKRYSFYSKLEKRDFGHIDGANKSGTLDEETIRNKSKEIHEAIMAGKFGKAEFIFKSGGPIDSNIYIYEGSEYSGADLIKFVKGAQPDFDHRQIITIEDAIDSLGGDMVIKKSTGGHLDSNIPTQQTLHRILWDNLKESADNIRYIGNNTFEITLNPAGTIDELTNNLKNINDSGLQIEDLKVSDLFINGGINADKKDDQGRLILEVSVNLEETDEECGCKHATETKIEHKSGDDMVSRIESEIKKHEDESYYGIQEAEDAQNKIFYDLKNNYGWDYEQDEEAQEYFLKATPSEILQYLLDKGIVKMAKGGETKSYRTYIVRKDILKRNEEAPVGNGYVGKGEFKGRWINDDEEFQIYHNGKWQEAESADWDLKDKMAKGGDIEGYTEDDYEDYLNDLYGTDAESAIAEFAHFTNESRGNHTTEEDIAYHASSGQLGTLFRKYDPIAFNVGYNDWKNNSYKKGGSVDFPAPNITKMKQMGITKFSEFGDKFREWINAIVDHNKKDGKYIGYQLDLVKDRALIVQEKATKTIIFLDYKEFPNEGSYELINDKLVYYEKGGPLETDEEGNTWRGRGWGKHTKGSMLTNLNELKFGDILLEQNNQFKAKNVVKVVNLLENRPENKDTRKIVYVKFVKPDGKVISHNQREGEMAIWYHDLENDNNEYFFPADKKSKGGDISESNMSVHDLFKQSANLGKKESTIAGVIVIEAATKKVAENRVKKITTETPFKQADATELEKVNTGVWQITVHGDFKDKAHFMKAITWLTHKPWFLYDETEFYFGSKDTLIFSNGRWLAPLNRKMARGGKFTTCPVGTEVQTLLFDTDKWNLKRAKKWARLNNFLSGKPDETENNIRLRQQDPSKFNEDSFRTIEFGEPKTGIKAVIGCPK